jgi:hypothetical protein
MSISDETGHMDPGTRVTVDAVWNRQAHGKFGSVVRWDHDRNVYFVRLDGWKHEMTFEARELVKRD